MPGDGTKTPELLRPKLREIPRRAPTAPSGNLAPPRDEDGTRRARRLGVPIIAVLAIASVVGLAIWLLASR